MPSAQPVDGALPRRSYGVWMSPGSSPRFAVSRLAVMLSLTLSGTWLCLTFRSLLLLPLALFCGTWPFPFRCRVGSSSLSVRWLFVRHIVPLANVTGCTLVARSSRLHLGHSQRLQIAVAGGQAVLLSGPPATLRALRSDLNDALSALDTNDSPLSDSAESRALSD